MTKIVKNSGDPAGNENNDGTENQIDTATIEANARKAESERQKAIRDLGQPGVEAIIDECLNDFECSAGDAAIKVSLALKKQTQDAASAALSDRQPSGSGNAAVLDEAEDHNIREGDEVIADDDYEGQWKANLGNCQAEFINQEQYAAYKRRLASGNMRHTSKLSETEK